MAAAKFLSLLVVLVAAARVGHAQERIKMCGRELIRLAVSACGNSRQRRDIGDVEPDQHQPITPHWTRDVDAEEPWPKEDVPSLAPHLSSRIRRASGGISDICCEKGCSMKELIQFC